jgi:hypothetical protein
MILFKSQPPAVDVDLFRAVMSQPNVARELFLPLNRAWWDGGRFTLGRLARKIPPPTLTGVRLQEPRSAKQGPPPERDTQGDLSALVGSVVELRRVPEFAAMVLSGETLIGRQKGTVPGKRVQFGLSCAAGGPFQAEANAAAQCHRVLRKAVRQAGFALDFPRDPFDPNSGFAGLRNWASALRLRRSRARRAWLVFLLLLPFLLLPFLMRLSIPGTPSMAALLGSSASPGALPGTSPMPMPTAAGVPNPGQPTPGQPTPGRPTLGQPAFGQLKTAPNPAKPAGPAAPAKLPTPVAPQPASPRNVPTDPNIDDLRYAEELMKKMQGLAGDPGKMSDPLSAIGGSDPMADRGRWLVEIGTIAYFVGGAWLIWAAPDAGIGAVIGLLLVPAYGLVIARSSWSKTWLPLLVHMAGLLLVIAGIYYVFAPMFRALQALTG